MCGGGHHRADRCSLSRWYGRGEQAAGGANAPPPNAPEQHSGTMAVRDDPGFRRAAAPSRLMPAGPAVPASPLIPHRR